MVGSAAQAQAYTESLDQSDRCAELPGETWNLPFEFGWKSLAAGRGKGQDQVAGNTWMFEEKSQGHS